MGRLLTEPWVLGTLVVVCVLLFAAPKLPAMARSLGQSMRIMKSEMKSMKEDARQLGDDLAEDRPEAATGNS